MAIGHIEIDNVNSVLSVGAGSKDSEVAKFCVKKNISGLEFLSGIPGTIGGNIKMNAGCYGNKISDDLIDCTIIDEKLNESWYIVPGLGDMGDRLFGTT